MTVVPQLSVDRDAPTLAQSRAVFRNVSKWYGDTVALSDVSFALTPGVTGLLGHNGAGKSTTLALLAGHLSASQGTVEVLGSDPRRDPSIHTSLGLVPDGNGLWPFLTARQTVTMLAAQRGVRDPGHAATVALTRVDLLDAADRKVGGFSKGMHQRVKLAQALAHDPMVLLLDEPLNGLDPAQRRADVDLIRRLGSEGRTVLVSSHVLGEVERMAERLLVIVNGRLVAEGSAAGIRDLMTEQPRTVRIASDAPFRLAQLLLIEELVHSVAIDSDNLTVETRQPTALFTALPSLARDAGIRLRRIVPLGEDLESIFTALTRAARGIGR